MLLIAAIVKANGDWVGALTATQHHQLVWIEAARADLAEAEGVVVTRYGSRRLVKLAVASRRGVIKSSSTHGHVL